MALKLVFVASTAATGVSEQYWKFVSIREEDPILYCGRGFLLADFTFGIFFIGPASARITPNCAPSFRDSISRFSSFWFIFIFEINLLLSVASDFFLGFLEIAAISSQISEWSRLGIPAKIFSLLSCSRMGGTAFASYFISNLKLARGVVEWVAGDDPGGIANMLVLRI